MEAEGLGAVGVEAVSHPDDSAHQDQQQHHAHAHACLVAHVHLLDQWEKSVSGVLSPGSDPPPW